VEIAFLHNLIFIRKGNNNEKANAPELIQRELAELGAAGDARVTEQADRTSNSTRTGAPEPH
jgi:hypothetical protein